MDPQQKNNLGGDKCNVERWQDLVEVTGKGGFGRDKHGWGPAEEIGV